MREDLVDWKERVFRLIGDTINGLLNGYYCKRCWKFYFCRQVPFSKKVFKPCKGFIEIQEELFKIVDIINKNWE